MTFEEGLERLKERHEALAQSLELMHRSQQDYQRDQREINQKFDSRFERLLKIAEHLLDSVRELRETAD